MSPHFAWQSSMSTSARRVGTAGGDVAHAALFDIRRPGAPVEIGFCSNAAEERNLGSAAYILI